MWLQGVNWTKIRHLGRNLKYIYLRNILSRKLTSIQNMYFACRCFTAINACLARFVNVDFIVFIRNYLCTCQRDEIRKVMI